MKWRLGPKTTKQSRPAAHPSQPASLSITGSGVVGGVFGRLGSWLYESDGDESYVDKWIPNPVIAATDVQAG